MNPLFYGFQCVHIRTLGLWVVHLSVLLFIHSCSYFSQLQFATEIVPKFLIVFVLQCGRSTKNDVESDTHLFMLQTNVRSVRRQTSRKLKFMNWIREFSLQEKPKLCQQIYLFVCWVFASDRENPTDDGW